VNSSTVCSGVGVLGAGMWFLRLWLLILGTTC
jgi:hypothetical protein